ncbi:Hsp20/alpha crystallin family protein [Lentzea aerocolonigenes]|uniref:Hsp20/alpha crystallin family protein n=1 Tax=Lentzea aerocolonigenes TaxID=68170 RepID=UPI0004C3E420|nr:Hsp20/alpha crystallin family protein [Lentzea aerocolonigenes]MCP2242414.1 HSP20 family protein [Lentzea aerocolonigenes]
MTLMRFDPFRELDRLSEQTVRTPRALPMEAFRRSEECVVALDLPGVDSADVDVTVERNVVTVKATRHPLRQENDEVLIDERPHGEFSRQFFLGDMLDAGNLSADFDRGVLVLTIPVAESSKPRKIEIS